MIIFQNNINLFIFQKTCVGENDGVTVGLTVGIAVGLAVGLLVGEVVGWAKMIAITSQ